MSEFGSDWDIAVPPQLGKSARIDSQVRRRQYAGTVAHTRYQTAAVFVGSSDTGRKTAGMRPAGTRTRKSTWWEITRVGLLERYYYYYTTTATTWVLDFMFFGYHLCVDTRASS